VKFGLMTRTGTQQNVESAFCYCGHGFPWHRRRSGRGRNLRICKRQFDRYGASDKSVHRRPFVGRIYDHVLRELCKRAGTSATAPLATLLAAANLVKPGGTVEVMNGTYTGPAYGNVL